MENLEPRQIDFLKYYLDPNSETFSNAYKSALKAGFTEEYSKVILNQNTEWLSESLSRRKRILNKAEKRGEELLDSKDERVKADLVKHFTKTLGKEHYSERSELTGKDGQPIQYNWSNYGNNPIPSEIVDKGIPRKPQEMESDSGTPEVRKNHGND